MTTNSRHLQRHQQPTNHGFSSTAANPVCDRCRQVARLGDHGDTIGRCRLLLPDSPVVAQLPSNTSVCPWRNPHLLKAPSPPRPIPSPVQTLRRSTTTFLPKRSSMMWAKSQTRSDLRLASTWRQCMPPPRVPSALSVKPLWFATASTDMLATKAVSILTASFFPASGLSTRH